MNRVIILIALISMLAGSLLPVCGNTNSKSKSWSKIKDIFK